MISICTGYCVLCSISSLRFVKNSCFFRVLNISVGVTSIRIVMNPFEAPMEVVKMEECVLCEEIITNPICIDCVENEMEMWLVERRPSLIGELQTKTNEINLSHRGTNCIICKNDMSICTICYRKHIFTWISRYPELLSEFKVFFTLDYFI